MGRSVGSETDRCDIISILFQDTLEFPCHRDVFATQYKHYICERLIPLNSCFINFLSSLAVYLTLAYLIAIAAFLEMPAQKRKRSFLTILTLHSQIPNARLNSKISRFPSTTTEYAS
jgi:hypothetical protein